MAEQAEDSPEAHPLARDAAAGMNPVSLVTGFYGARGERIRHRVHEGALRLPEAALEICSESSGAGVPAVKKEYSLPSVDSVVRPSVDPTIPQFTVTEVRKEDISQDIISPEDGSVETKTIPTIFVNNRVIVRQVGGAERIREGGDEAAGNAPQNPSVEDRQKIGVVAPESSGGPEAPTSHAAINTTESVAGDLVTKLEAVPTETAPTYSAEAGAPSRTTNESTDATKAATPAESPSIQTAAVLSAATAAQPLTIVSAPPAMVSSSGPTTDGPEPRVIALEKRPAAQWDQHKAGATDELAVDISAKIPRPDWYKSDSASNLESAVLSEWFDGSAVHRTTETYVQAREKIIEMSCKLGHSRYITSTMVRRSIPGDAGSLLRLHSFLTSYALINEDAINESAPTPIIFQKKSASWNDESRRETLMQAVVEQVRKRPKVMAAQDFVPIDWEVVAASVGHGTTPSDCERQFLVMPIDSRHGQISPEAAMGEDQHSTDTSQTFVKQELLKDLIDGTDAAVLSAVTKAALGRTHSIEQAQRAGVVGVVVHRAAMEARSQEDAVARILGEVVDLRMKKLENRMALLDDVEGMLEAERVALELERRDLYTARCRHWFGGT